MALSSTRYEHISLDDVGTPLIAGTRTKVVEPVSSYLASGSSPEELHLNFPQLSLGQIYSALAYYWDHQQALDEDIAKRLEQIDALKKRLPVPTFVERLKRRRPTDAA